MIEDINQKSIENMIKDINKGWASSKKSIEDMIEDINDGSKWRNRKQTS